MAAQAQATGKKRWAGLFVFTPRPLRAWDWRIPWGQLACISLETRSGKVWMIIWDLVVTPKLPEPGHCTGPKVLAPEDLCLQTAQATSHLQGPSAPGGRPRLVSGFSPVPSQHTILGQEMRQRHLSQIHHRICGGGKSQ